MKLVNVIVIFLVIVLGNLSYCKGQVLTDHQFSFAMGVSFDHSNVFYPTFRNSEIPKYYSEDWEEDNMAVARSVEVGWRFKISGKFPIALKYIKSDFKENLSDPLMWYSKYKYDKTYHAIFIGSYYDFLPKDSKIILSINYGLELYKMYVAIPTYTVMMNDQGEYMPDIPLVINENNYGVNLHTGLDFGIRTPAINSIIGVKINSFGLLSDDILGWSISPSFTYQF